MSKLLCILLGVFTVAGSFGVVSPAFALVLWHVNNTLSPTQIPAYRGQVSPFPQPQQLADATKTIEAEQLAARRQFVLAEARRLVAHPAALQLNSASLKIRGVTNGRRGMRVLVGDTWVGLNEVIPVTYSVNPETLAALSQLQAIDEASAIQLRNKLNTAKQELEKAGASITAVNIRTKQLTLKTPSGVRTISMALEP